MRRKKFPKDFKSRRALAEVLYKKGYTWFDIILLLGYTLSSVEARSKIGMGLLSHHQRRLLADDNYRETVVNSLLSKMEGENVK